MTEIGEREPNQPNPYHERTYEYFLYSESQLAELVEYRQQGLAYTNNLHLYFKDEPDEWPVEGGFDPHDYRRRHFGSVVEYFRENHSELWEEVKQAVANCRKAERDRLEQLNRGDDVFQTELRIDALRYLKRDATSRAFDVLAPLLEQQGIDPIDVLK